MLYTKNFNIDTPNPTFEVFQKGSTSGVANLSRDLTINGTTVSPTLLYYGGDANSTNWTAQIGETLVLQAGTAPSYNQGSPLLGTNDDSVKFNSGGYYRASTASIGDITTEDMVVECIVRMSAFQPLVLFGHRTGAVPGWKVATTTATRLFCTIGSGTTQISAGVTGILTANCWYHVLFFLDRSGSSISYVNGVASAAVDISALVAASLSTDDLFTVGAASDGGNACDCPIALLAMWKQASWLDTHLQAALALERFNKLLNLMPQVALGTAAPTAQTRASATHLNNAGELYRVGANWLRVESPGYFCEPAATNKILQSQVFQSDGVWTLLDAGDTFGTQLCNDADMEAATTAAWSTTNGATLTKETTTPHGGTNCLRVARGTTNNPNSYQVVLTVGKTYCVTGWARSNGVSNPYVYLGIATGYEWVGTTSTDWQYFTLIRKVTDTRLALASNATTGNYVEFDDIKLYEVTETAPNKELESSGLVPDSTNGIHGFTQAVILTAVNHTLSVYAKAGAQNWIYLSDDTVANATCYFDLGTGVVGTSGAGISQTHIESLGDGWYRAGITFLGTVAAHTLSIQSAEADNDASFAGNGTSVSTYFWGAQLELGNIATSYITTTTAAASRSADILTFSGTDNIADSQGTISFDVLTPDYTPEANAICYRLTNGGGVTNYISQYICVPDILKGISAATAGSAGSMTINSEITDGTVHHVSAHWETDRMYATLDGVRSDVDTDVDIPTTLNQIHVGHGNTATQLNGIISNIKIYKRLVNK